MIELIQFPCSPFCIVQSRILEFSGTNFKIINIPNTDRSLVWRLTKQRYYGVPIIRDGKSVIFELNDDSQVIAKYLDSKLGLGLFPWGVEGVQSIIWKYIENDIEGPCFRLNDIWYKDQMPASEWLPFLRHKERKFGRGCSSSPSACSLSKKCCWINPSCWTNDRGSSISTSSACWAISSIRATTGSRPSIPASRPGIAA